MRAMRECEAGTPDVAQAASAGCARTRSIQLRLGSFQMSEEANPLASSEVPGSPPSPTIRGMSAPTRR